MNGIFDYVSRHAAAIPLAGGLLAALTAAYYFVTGKAFGSRRIGKAWERTREFMGNKDQLKLATKVRNPDNLTHGGESKTIEMEVVQCLEYILVGNKRYAVLRSYVYSYRRYQQWKTLKGFGDDLSNYPPAEIFPGMGLREDTDENGVKYSVKIAVPDVRVPEHDQQL